MDRRYAAAWVLARLRAPEGLLALAVLAKGERSQLSELALDGLIGWDAPLAHSVFSGLYGDLDRGEPDAEALHQLERVEDHFGRLQLERASRAEAELGRLVSRFLAQDNWRRASRAVTISQALDSDLVVPMLIQGLGHWVARGARGEASLRMQYEITGELERRSGRSIGPHPERWTQWWRAVREGRVPIRNEDANGSRSESGFFGLRPASDRITFVIDRSTSMENAFGRSTQTIGGRAGHSRYDEAVQQMLGFLEHLGPRCHFNVILFSDRLDAWHSDLREASKIQLSSARSWLKAKRPRGSTGLRGGIEKALKVKHGKIDLEELEIDTVIVLCDGETDEGPSWVVPFLERYNDRARVVFYTVRIGRYGDGTLELLSQLTGGEFVSVDG